RRLHGRCPWRSPTAADRPGRRGCLRSDLSVHYRRSTFRSSVLPVRRRRPHRTDLRILAWSLGGPKLVDGTSGSRSARRPRCCLILLSTCEVIPSTRWRHFSHTVCEQGSGLG